MSLSLSESPKTDFVPYCLVVTGRERADLLALVYVYSNFVTFPFGIMGQVWYLIVSIPDPCCLSYFVASRPIGTDFTILPLNS